MLLAVARGRERTVIQSYFAPCQHSTSGRVGKFGDRTLWAASSDDDNGVAYNCQEQSVLPCTKPYSGNCHNPTTQRACALLQHVQVVRSCALLLKDPMWHGLPGSFIWHSFGAKTWSSHLSVPLASGTHSPRSGEVSMSEQLVNNAGCQPPPFSA